MSQGTVSELRLFEDFLFANMDATEATITDTAPQRIGQVTVGGDDTALTLVATVDEPGGVLSIDVTDDTIDEGFAVYSAAFKPADGAVAFETRFQVNDLSATNIFVGFMESFTPDDPDQGMPYTMATTTITVVDLGVTAGIFVDHNADNDDWYFAAAQDAAAANGVTLVAPAVGGGRMGVDLSGDEGDDEWIIFRVEIEQDGTAFGYVGSSHTDAGGSTLRLVGRTDRGALDATAMVYPILLVHNDGNTGVTGKVDYYAVNASRDWSV